MNVLVIDPKTICVEASELHQQEQLDKLGFEVIGGEIDQNWLILQNSSCTIGLFQGMFERNCLTFNPGIQARAVRQH